MASNRYHIAPDGAELCRAWLKRCEYEHHYSSLKIAQEQDAIIKDNNLFRAELKRLQDGHRNPDPKLFSRSSFMFNRADTSPRNFAQEVDARIHNLGVRPEIYHSMGQFRMNNGNGMEVNVQVMRMTEVDERLACYSGVWRFIVKKNKVGLQRDAETVRDVIFDFSTEEAIQASIPEVSELFRTAAISSGIYNQEKADNESATMLAHFKAMFNAVESDAAGDFDVWNRGMGYFTESDSETIVVNEDYWSSAFRAENFRRFLSDCLYYRSTQPNVEIRVSDHHFYTGASWALIRHSDQWSVEKKFADGSVENVPLETPQDALDHVYCHALAEVNPDNEELSFEKGRYAEDLFKGVEEALEANKAVVAEWWRKQREYQAAAVAGKLDGDKKPAGILGTLKAFSKG